jgi:hypothetical protein
MSARGFVVALAVVSFLAAFVVAFVVSRLTDDQEAAYPACPEVWSVAEDAPCIHDTLPGDGVSYLIQRNGIVRTLDGDHAG